MTIVEIKAELYDLRYHNCNGVLSIHADGRHDYKPCDGCSRIIKLTSMLKDAIVGQTSVSTPKRLTAVCGATRIVLE